MEKPKTQADARREQFNATAARAASLASTALDSIDAILAEQAEFASSLSAPQEIGKLLLEHEVTRPIAA